MPDRPEESWVLVLVCCPQGRTLDKPLSPPGPEFLHLYIDACCVLGTGVVCEQDGQFLPPGADIIVEATVRSPQAQS